MLGRRIGLAAAAALVIASPAQATMACWNETQTAAAQVRNLQSRLMVASLRCVAMGHDVTPAYNRFVRASRETIQGANGVIMAQFRAGHGGQAQVQPQALSAGAGDKLVLNMDAQQVKQQARQQSGQEQPQGK